MRRVILYIFIIPFLVFAKVDIAKDLNATSNIKLFLWEAKKGDKKFYLLGTMHLPNPKITYNIAPKVKRIIDRVDSVHTEIPMDFLTQMAVSKTLYRDDNKTLKDILPAKTYKKFKTYLASINSFIDIRYFDRFKIWSLGMILGALEYEIKYRDFKPLDKEIFDYSFSKKKFGGGIEKIEEQTELFENLTLKEQIELFDASLDSYIKYPDMMKKLLDYYFRGDENGLIKIYKKSNKLLNVDKKLLDKVNNSLLFFRNKRMANRIEDFIKDNKIHIFAFGAMHFVGKRSVIDILKDKGYIIRRVTFKEVVKDDKRD